MPKKKPITMDDLESTHDEASRDFETELIIANATVDQMKLKMEELEVFNSQLQDIARMQTASTLLPHYLPLFRDEKGAIEAAINTADEFVSYYSALMEKNSAELNKRVNEQVDEMRKKAEQAQKDAGESVN